MSIQMHKFSGTNAAGGRQFVAHRVYVDGSNVKYSIWFSDHEGGTLVDAERIDRAGRAIGVKRSSLKWAALERKARSLIADYDRKEAAYLAERKEPETIS